MCRAMVLRAPLASVEDAEDVAEVEEEDLDALWARALAEAASDLLALVAQARAAGLGGDLLAEVERAAAAPVGETEVSRLRALQFRQGAARELATLLRDAGYTSAEIAEWAPDRRVRPRLA
jgi:hypothetical protein